MFERKSLVDKNGDFIVKPMRFYNKEKDINYDEIDVGDIVVAETVAFYKPDIIVFDVGGIEARMDMEYFSLIKDDVRNLKEVYANIGKKALCRVIKKSRGRLILERTWILKDTIDYLEENVGNVVNATIETIAPFGVFVDIGNGVISLVHVSEISKAHIRDIAAFLTVGTPIQVKILNYNSEKMQFALSRKQAYPKLTEEELPLDSGIIVTCTGINDVGDGIYVEFNPGNVGILDIPEYVDLAEFYEGRKIVTSIKALREKGFRCRFRKFVI